MADAKFDQVVGVLLAGEWVAVQSARDALELLQNRWPEMQGASYERALAACLAFLDGSGPMQLSKSTFCVAAMEAGLVFDLYDDHMSLIEAQIALVVKAGVKGDDRPDG